MAPKISQEEFAMLKADLKRELRNELFAELNKKLEENGAGWSNLFDGQKSELENAKKKVTELEKENADLKAEVKLLTGRIDTSESRHDESELYSRKNNIEIKGIPCLKGENCDAIVAKLAQALNVNCDVAKDIEAAHRVPSAKGGPETEKSLIVRCLNRRTKGLFIAAARTRRPKASSLGFKSDTPIYVNEHLTGQRKRLLGMAKARCKDNNWKFCWSTNGGTILARRNEEANAVKISNEADLVKIRGAENANVNAGGQRDNKNNQGRINLRSAAVRS
jgi:hypothetical protein